MSDIVMCVIVCVCIRICIYFMRGGINEEC